MPSYILVFAQSHSEFRIPELESVAQLHGFAITLPLECDPLRPFMVLDLASEEHARLLAGRCILIKHIYEFYAQGGDYEELHVVNKANGHLWSSYAHDTSFKFLVTAYNHKIPQRRQRDVVESFSYMAFAGKIDMKNPQIVLGCFEEYDSSTGLRQDRDSKFRQVYFGRLVIDGSARALIKMFDVKKRLYYGNTSMESEVSLLMANQALASSSKLVYDPFCGTGSMAYPIAYFGAQVFGSDIDGRQMRGKAGKDQPPGVLRAAKQYGVADRIVDLCTFDVTRNPWRCGDLFDTIVTDPPYGVRAGAKRLGRKKELSEDKKAANIEHQMSARNKEEPYVPPTKPYELSLLAADLVLLARYLLKPEGRLVFFLPTVNEQYEEVDIQAMLCDGMVLVANSLQDFGSWGRRLVTIRKATHESYPPPCFEEERDPDARIPAHKDFREQYFRGFKKENDVQ
ncbi:S-adenosyl-L-methionine-dependent methyltransferase [Mycena alexandri]|uniref:tRNA (guanine(10)-N(2))-methyltransferase n=1 Tax=Mycena alexandri TaxID=1745969 RepID=A0AAD6TKD8_9AGAR|nr:S-adenosyl-L-methionine-dependent methyltransferase [Mycena alexandri]